MTSSKPAAVGVTFKRESVRYFTALRGSYAGRGRARNKSTSVSLMIGASEATGIALSSSFGLASRRLLNHCFNDSGHHGDAHSNSDWKRIIAWLVNLLGAVGLLVYVFIRWPPPPRVFPRRRPILSVPWCVTARLLGYGVFDWRTGKLTPWWDYIKEKHEILNVFAGDAGFITQRGRFALMWTAFACTLAVSMVLTDLTTTKVTGDFWTHQIWVFALLLTYDIVLGIGLRLITVGATHASFQAAERVGFECAEKGDINNLEDEEQLMEMGRKASMAFNYEQKRMTQMCFMFACSSLLVCALWAHLANPADGCGSAFQTFLAYAYTYGLYQAFSLIVINPFSLSVRWWISVFLFTRIEEVQTAEETMDCCWKRNCPKCCSCRAPLVTPLEQKTIEHWLVTPKKDQSVTAGHLAVAAAAAGKVRYNVQDSPTSPATPLPQTMTKDQTTDDSIITPRRMTYDEDSEDIASTQGAPTPQTLTPEAFGKPLAQALTPEQKYSTLKKAASARYRMTEEEIDQDVIRGRPVVRLRTPEAKAENLANSASFAAARMALMAAGKLTPEQIVRTRSFAHAQLVSRYADSDSDVSIRTPARANTVIEEDDVEMARGADLSPQGEPKS